MIINGNEVIILVSREDVEDINTIKVVTIINSFIPRLLERNRNKVRIEVLGYYEDSRELFDIPEVRLYFQQLHKDIPGFFYWIDIESYMLLFLALMLYQPIRISNNVTISSNDLQFYLLIGLKGLKEFCAEMEITSVPTTNLIRKTIGLIT